jgi:glycogen synthase
MESYSHTQYEQHLKKQKEKLEISLEKHERDIQDAVREINLQKFKVTQEGHKKITELQLETQATKDKLQDMQLDITQLIQFRVLFPIL